MEAGGAQGIYNKTPIEWRRRSNVFLKRLSGWKSVATADSGQDSIGKFMTDQR